MALACGIVGLPNVGKSTLFNALTNASVAASNFPFCTIDPNVGVVPVPDPRLTQIAERVHPESVIPTTVTFTDIAGLVKGASEGEGLGNQFLGHIKNTQAIVHVVRCFEDPNVVHVDGSVDPIRDASVIETELMLADLATVLRRYGQWEKVFLTQPKNVPGFPVLKEVKMALERGTAIRTLALSREVQLFISDLHLMTAKPILYVANVSEGDIPDPFSNSYVQKLKNYVGESDIVPICGKLEAEISQLAGEEKTAYLQSAGLSESGLDRLIKAAYRLLGLATFFTAGPKEVRAWTIPQGATAVEAAGAIHSDFAKGFIKAEVYHVNDLMQWGSEASLRSKGLLRMEGKDYIVKDGDVMFFRFNV